jgi:hypothetical protein
MQKTHVQYSLTITAGLFLASIVNQPLLATTRVVGGCVSGKQYATIQAAVTASAAGDTVKVCPGNYPEQVVISQGITLTGVANGTGAANPVITTPASGVLPNATSLADGTQIAAQILVQGTTGVSIKQIAVDGSNNGLNSCTNLVGIFFQNASGSVSYTTTRNQVLGAGLDGCPSGQGIFIQSFSQSAYASSGGTATVSVTNNNVHDYQKTGIIADGDGTNVTIQLNHLVGLGPIPYIVQNGIQFSRGATGTASLNTVANDVYTGPNSYGATGILVYASENVSVTDNVVGSTQLGIATVTDPNSATPGNPGGVADNTLIQSNRVTDTQTFDAVYVCSNGNTILSNTLTNSSNSAIHLALECNSTVSSNTVSKNCIDEACAAVLESGSGNTITGDNNNNVAFIYQAGDTCSLPLPSVHGRFASHAPPLQQLRVAPY